MNWSRKDSVVRRAFALGAAGHHGPIGLDLKAKSPAETAIVILGEVIRVRYGEGSGESLFGTDVAIHTG